MENRVYLVDCGYLIKKGEREFDSYAIVYDKKYGYYDDNQYYTMNYNEEEFDKLLGGNNSYVVVTLQDSRGADHFLGITNATEQDLNECPIENDDYSVGAIAYCVMRNDKGEIVKDFIKG